jgi:membrane protease YdiL (CAAX protease family)
MPTAESHPVGRTLVLHLLPGALAAALFFIIGPSLTGAGYPPQLALTLAILFVIIPFELGYLLYEGKRLTGVASVRPVIPYRERLALRNFLILVPSLVAWSAFVFITMAPLDPPIAGALFSWLPAWSISAFSAMTVAQYSPESVRIAFVLGLAINGVAGPVVEELYFRGYLLPRIPATRPWSPLVNTVLFSIYHFFSPWQFLTRVVAGLPLVYAVSWKRNVYIGAIVHSALNTLGWILAYVIMLRSAAA